MLLREILDLDPLPFKWLTTTTGEFYLDEQRFGIVLEETVLNLPDRALSVVNVLFGTVHPTEQITPLTINRALTGFGKPRTVMATVAEACVNNHHFKSFDIFIVAASDQVKEKRIGIYTLAISDIASRVPEYKHSYRAITPTGNILVVYSKNDLSDAEVAFVGKEILRKDQH